MSNFPDKISYSQISASALTNSSSTSNSFRTGPSTIVDQANEQIKKQQELKQAEEENRKKYEKERQYQLQQKRLQEMSLSKGKVTSNQGEQADTLIKNILQKVDTDAKLTKRTMTQKTNYLSATNSQVPSSNPVQVPSISSISGAVPLYYSSNSNPASRIPNYSNLTLNPSQFTSNQQASIASNMFGTFKNAQTSTMNQEQLNAFASNIPMALSTNQFVNVQTSQSTTLNTASLVTSPIPSWCQQPNKIPNLYENIWQSVQIPGSSLADTSKVYPILLSSGLPKDLLAQLWAKVNQTVAGQLTQTELYIMLALIAVLQQKPTSNPYNEIFQAEKPLVPNLQLVNQPAVSSVIQSSTVIQPSVSPVIQPSVLPVIQSVNQSYEQKSSQTSNPQSSSFIANDTPITKEDEFANFTQAELPLKNESFKQVEPITKSNNISGFDFDETFKASNNQEQNFADFDKLNDQKLVTTNEIVESNDIDEGNQFADFSFAPFEQNKENQILNSEDKKEENFEQTKGKNENSTNKNCLKDALLLNISALAPMSSKNDNKTGTISQSSSENFVTNWPSDFQNTNDASSSSSLNNETVKSIDKYSAFKELTLENNSQQTNDFANFSSQNLDAVSIDSLKLNSLSVNDDPSKSIEEIWIQVLQCCKQLLHKAFNVLVVNHGQNSSIEALLTSQGNSFAFDLVEVYSVAKRISKNVKHENYQKLIEDIDKTWSTLINLFAKASITINVKEDVEVENFEKHCAICQTASSSSSNDPLLKLLSFAGYDYHSTCANLWLNCINGTLPQPQTS